MRSGPPTGGGSAPAAGTPATLLPDPPRPHEKLQLRLYLRYQLTPAASAKPALPRTTTRAPFAS